MTGWLIFAGAALLAFLLLWRLGRLERGPAMLVASALCVAGAGYAWQGEPGLPSAPAAAAAQQGLKRDTLFAIERQRFLGRFGAVNDYLGDADAMNRIGVDRAAVTVLQTGIAKYPRDPDLRIGLAHALFVQADGIVTPAVTLALDQAQALAPTDPAPRYFRGLMLLEGGDLPRAEGEWRALLASLPKDSPWAGQVALRLRAFDMIRAAQQQGASPGVASGEAP